MSPNIFLKSMKSIQNNCYTYSHLISQKLENRAGRWRTTRYSQIFLKICFSLFSTFQFLFFKGSLKENYVAHQNYVTQETIGSSRPEVFLWKVVLKIRSKFTVEHPYRSAISIKLLGFLKGLVTHNDILKIYRTITIKIYFQNILKSFLKYFRNKHFSKEKSRFM